ncbi:lysoplasmalogenase [Nocardioides korecus]
MLLRRRPHLPRTTGDAGTTSRRLTAGYAVLAATDTWLAGRPEAWAHRARVITKPALMPTLAGSLLLAPGAATSPVRSSTLVAEVAGWGGDVALLREGTGAFLTGAGSFAVGHAAYLSGFWRHRRREPLLDALGPRVVLATAATTTPVIAVLAGRHDRVLALAVLAYAGALATMTSAALHLDRELPTRARVLVGAGAVLFLVSDTVLAWRTFAPPPALPPAPGPAAELTSPATGVPAPSPRPDPWERLVMGTYTTAQLLIRLGAGAAGTPSVVSTTDARLRA